MYNWTTFLYSRNDHNTVNQVYFNKINLKRKRKWIGTSSAPFFSCPEKENVQIETGLSFTLTLNSCKSSSLPTAHIISTIRWHLSYVNTNQQFKYRKVNLLLKQDVCNNQKSQMKEQGKDVPSYHCFSTSYWKS